MFSFFKKKERVLIPEWASFESPQEYTEFKNAIISYFNDYEVQFDFDEGVININDAELFGGNVITLTNLSRYCLSSETAGVFAARIEEFIGKVREVRDYDPQSQNFETVKSELGLRIITNKVFKLMGEKSYIGFPFFENLFYFLVFDLQDSVRGVGQSDVAAWNISHSELMEIGKNNIEIKYPQKITLEDMGGLKIWMVENDYFYAPNLLFNIEKYLNLVGTYGSLVGVPNGQRLFIYPIEDIGVTDDLGKLSALCKYFYENKINPISENFYWYYQGDYEMIPYDGMNPDFTLLPERFISMLRSLM